jgi:cytoskeletal protein CcmA (bactofilin family)
MKLKKDNPDDILSLLAEGVELNGELTFTNGIRVDGVVRGRIRSDSSMIIGPKGRVEAETEIRRISVNGEFHGAIRASDRVEIHREGKVYGDIYTPCLIIEAGALFEGKCNMNDQKAAAQTHPAPDAGDAAHQTGES